MKLTVLLFQICAVYLLLGCRRCSLAMTTALPNVTGKEHADEFSLNSTERNEARPTTVKPYAAYYHIMNRTLDEKNVSTSDTLPLVIDNMINDDGQPTNNHGSRNRSKQKDYSKYEQQFKSLLEYLASASRKYKAKMMTTEQSLGKELTTNTFNDLAPTEMPQTKHPSMANTTAERLNSSAESTFTPLAVVPVANSTTAYYRNFTTTTEIPTTTTVIPTTTTVITTTSTTPPRTTPYYPTTIKPKPNKFSCTLCVIIVVNE